VIRREVPYAPAGLEGGRLDLGLRGCEETSKPVRTAGVGIKMAPSNLPPVSER